MDNYHCTFKVSVVGCGNVGATIAYSYLLSGSVTDLTLIDIDEKKANGLHLDLEHALSFTPHSTIQATSDFSEAAGSNIIVVTAGKRQKEGETRLDLVKANKEIFADIIPKLKEAAPNAIFLIVSNPVDVLTHEALKLSGLPPSQVFGSGTILDSARLQFHISQEIGIHPSSVDAYVLGEHGDTSFPVYSTASVLGKPLLDLKNFSTKQAEKCFKETKEAAYNIINDLGYTCYSIATAVREITKAIFENQHKVFPLSVMLENYHGHSKVCLSVPCVLGRKGIEKILELPLNQEEKDALERSVATLKSYI